MGYQKVKSNTILVYSLPMTKLLQPCMLSFSFMGASVDGIARMPLVPRLGYIEFEELEAAEVLASFLHIREGN